METIPLVVLLNAALVAQEFIYNNRPLRPFNDYMALEFYIEDIESALDGTYDTLHYEDYSNH